MELRACAVAAWNFLTRPVSPLPLGVYRCLFGILSVVNGALLAPDLLVWFGDDGLMPAELVPYSIGTGRLDILAWTGSTPTAVYGVFAAFMVAAILTALGLCSRAATIVLFLATVTLHHRNIHILSSGDTIFRLMSFLLMLAPSGAAFSLDRVIRVRRGLEAADVSRPIPPTAFRLIQLQLCLVYFATGYWKASGSMWMDGSAVFVVHQLGQFERFPLPDFAHTLWFSRIATWSTLAVELLAPFLVWFRETRRAALAALVLMHVGLEYAMTIQLFQPVIVAVLVVFLTEDELLAVARAIASRLLPHAAARRPAGPPSAAEHGADVAATCGHDRLDRLGRVVAGERAGVASQPQ